MFNPLGFRYFEAQNPCSAWEAVFRPIVTAVRDSYDTRGRKHYGRLATFIEERYPSRLAFPEGSYGLSSPRNTNMPMRMVSFSRKGQRIESSGPTRNFSLDILPVRGRNVITARDVDEVDAELRNVTEKYGGVVERPKFKKTMKEWLLLQKERAKQRKRLMGLSGPDSRGESPMFGCQGIDGLGGPLPSPTGRRPASLGPSDGNRQPPSPTSLGSSKADTVRKNKEKLKRLVPFGMYGMSDVDTGHASPRSPDHGITRLFEVPDSPTPSIREPLYPTAISVNEVVQPRTRPVPASPTPKPRHRSSEEPNSPTASGNGEGQLFTKPAPVFALPGIQRKSSDGVYTAIRNSNPFTVDNESPRRSLILEDDTDGMSVVSSMVAVSAIPEPLFKANPRDIDREEKKHERKPSYEGTGYGGGFSPSSTAQDRQQQDPYLHPTANANHDRKTNRSLNPLPPLQVNKGGAHLHESANVEHKPSPGSFDPFFHARTRSSPQENADPPPPIPVKSPRRVLSARESGTSNFSFGSSHATATSPILLGIPDGYVLGRSSSVQGGHLDSPVRSSFSSLDPIPQALGNRIVSLENIRAHLSPKASFESEQSEPATITAVMAAAPPPLPPFQPNAVNQANTALDAKNSSGGDVKSGETLTTPARKVYKTLNYHMFPRDDDHRNDEQSNVHPAFRRRPGEN